MFAKILITLAMIGSAGAACANDLFGRPEYGPSGITRAVGYHDHARTDGTWSIETRSSSMQRSGYAMDMALYRAAEVATQQGHRFIQLLRSEATIGTGTLNRGAETVSLIVRFADMDAPPADCLQRGRHPGTCYTAEAAKILSRLEPRVRNASWRLDTAEALQDAQPVSDHSGLQRFVTIFRFDVTERGKVENCSLAQSDAPADVNAGACRMFLIVAHVKAAHDDAGNPIRSTRTARVIWQRSDLGGVTTMIRMPEDGSGGATVTASAAADPASRTVAELSPPAPPPVPQLAQGAPVSSRAAMSGTAKSKPKGPSSSLTKAAAHDDTVLVPF